MILTDKAKKDFLDFYWSNYIGKTRFISKKENTEDFFKSLYPILKNALIIEFFDSVGIIINTYYNTYSNGFVYELILNEKIVNTDNNFKCRKQATEQAIKKANEIYNER